MSDIPWSKLTHAIHFKAYPADGTGTLAGISDANATQFTAAAHAAGVKALICIADNNGNHSAFSAAAANLNTFVSNIVSFVTRNNYDGVDLDWEASSYRGTTDGTNYINLINALHSALPTKLITMAVYWNNGLENVAQGAAGALNQVNVMCYDMDQWLSYTYHNDATYRPSGDTTNCSCATEAAQFAGYIPSAKIGLGIPFYGRIWSGCADSACSDGLHDPMQSWSGTPSQSTILYRDLVASSYWSSPQVWDSARGATYISINQAGSSSDRFITFASVQQINEVAKLRQNQGYGGVMLYEVEYDFVSSASGDARHPLATAAYAAVNGTSSSTPPPQPTPTAPIVSGGSPSGTLAAGTTQTTMAVATNVNATCKYATAAGTAYSAMPYTFATTGGTAHSTPLTGLVSGTSYNCYVRCAGAGGNADTSDYTVSFAVASAAPAPAPTTPLGISISPSTGSGASQVFTVQATSPHGTSSMTQVDAVFGTLGTPNSCYFEYSPQSRTLYLQTDSGSTWSSAALGSGAALSNSQCSVNTAATSVSASGNTLTVSLAMSFTPAYAGSHTIYGASADNTGGYTGWLTFGSWTVPSAPAPAPTTTPVVTIGVSPNAGSGTSQTFTLKETSSSGYTSLRQADLLIGTQVGATNSCYAEYQPNNNTVFLLSDNNSVWTHGTMGSSTVLQNSQCAVNLAASTASGSGNSLAVSLAFSFTPAFAGARTLFTFGADTAVNTGWQTAGTWTVTAPPVPTGLQVTVSPSAAAGRSQIFTFQLSDSNGANTVEELDVDMGSQVGAVPDCRIEYWAPSNTLYLKVSGGSTWYPATLGSAATLSNGYCSVNAAATTVSRSGAIMTIQIPVSFTTSFLGTQNIFTFGADTAGLTTGWQQSGSYTVQ